MPCSAVQCSAAQYSAAPAAPGLQRQQHPPRPLLISAHWGQSRRRTANHRPRLPAGASTAAPPAGRTRITPPCPACQHQQSRVQPRLFILRTVPPKRMGAGSGPVPGARGLPTEQSHDFGPEVTLGFGPGTRRQHLLLPTAPALFQGLGATPWQLGATPWQLG